MFLSHFGFGHSNVFPARSSPKVSRVRHPGQMMTIAICPHLPNDTAQPPRREVNNSPPEAPTELS